MWKSGYKCTNFGVKLALNHNEEKILQGEKFQKKAQNMREEVKILGDEPQEKKGYWRKLQSFQKEIEKV